MTYANEMKIHATTEWYKSTLKRIATYSDHPDTQTACFIQAVDGMCVGAANQFPNGLHRLCARYEKPLRTAFIQHAEQRAIGNAADDGLRLRGATMWLNWFPCAPCAQAIVSAGIKCLWADKAHYEARKGDARYQFEESMAILVECGVKLEWM